jgi:hypothetical protein
MEILLACVNNCCGQDSGKKKIELGFETRRILDILRYLPAYQDRVSVSSPSY